MLEGVIFIPSSEKSSTKLFNSQNQLENDSKKLESGQVTAMTQFHDRN